MGARNWIAVPARQATQPSGIGSLESILGLLKSFKIRAQNYIKLAGPLLLNDFYAAALS
jgi:hypothetical protein